MATKIPNLWSQKDVKVEVLSPLAILRTQAANLEQMTQGLIEAEVTTTTGESGEIVYQLDIIAPVLGGYCHRLLAISHQQDRVYPVKFAVTPDAVLQNVSPHGYRAFTSAQTEAEFLKNLGEILQSPSINALIQSIIARSNDVQNTDQQYEMAGEAVA